MGLRRLGQGHLGDMPRIDSTVLASLASLASLAVLACTGGCSNPAGEQKVLVLGFDGMDPAFIERHRERLPNLMRLAQRGGFSELETVMPPQSPVAWSTVITGMTPAGHGIFDFVHRHPQDISPFSSMAKAVPGQWSLQVGQWLLPLDGGKTVPLRKGQAFWEVLNEHDVPSTMIKMPTDFPPLAAATSALAGMGTPDMLGSFGTFSYITNDPDSFFANSVSGGSVQRVRIVDSRTSAAVQGPVNTFRIGEPDTRVPLMIDLDVEHQAVRIEVGQREVAVLNVGEWSDWIPLEFELVPHLASASGMVRLYLRSVSPFLNLYVSPVNINPETPEVAISEPADFAAELAQAIGPFYTQGMAQETKALSAHLLTRDEFITQANMVYDEEIAMFDHLLPKFQHGLMFHYFSTTDQAAHMLWGDFEHDLVPIYERADAVVGRALDHIDENTTLLVISDHGFARFDREVHLNRWLMDQGLLTLDDPDNASDAPGFVHVDWSKTKAYAMGLNGLYINRLGREGHGIVPEQDVPRLKAAIEAKLVAWHDPQTGAQIVQRLYDPADLIVEGEATATEFAPDLLVGFAPPYRMSPATGLGAVPRIAVERNTDAWIGDHCMAHDNVPGVLFSNRKITAAAPRLHDIPVSILAAFGIEAPPQMVGKNVIAN